MLSVSRCSASVYCRGWRLHRSTQFFLIRFRSLGIMSLSLNARGSTGMRKTQWYCISSLVCVSEPNASYFLNELYLSLPSRAVFPALRWWIIHALRGEHGMSTITSCMRITSASSGDVIHMQPLVAPDRIQPLRTHGCINIMDGWVDSYKGCVHFNSLFVLILKLNRMIIFNQKTFCIFRFSKIIILYNL